VIITQTPLRIGLVGGGTDLPDYYRDHGGRVLNCAIDKYIFVIVKERFDDEIYVNYSKKETVSKIDDLEHELVREAMRMTGVTSGVEITMLADIPSAGSGLGSSSSVTVGLLQALWGYQGHQVTGEDLAKGACEIEIDICGKRIGKQDQYIAALGGIRDIHFGPGEDVVAEELGLSTAERRAFQQQVMLFYTGVTRNATTILTEQSANVSSTLGELNFMRDLAGVAVEHLRNGDVYSVGTALRDGWEAKRKLASGVSNAKIDDAVARALAAGASGAKVTGAGGGGFLLVICLPEHQGAVRDGLPEMRELPVKLDRLGSRVVFNVTRDIWG
jgi:D-glycero-alpha-D-manno-heptose-7-phosphate kinase